MHTYQPIITHMALYRITGRQVVNPQVVQVIVVVIVEVMVVHIGTILHIGTIRIVVEVVVLQVAEKVHIQVGLSQMGIPRLLHHLQVAPRHLTMHSVRSN